jgi:hypothetical protein
MDRSFLLSYKMGEKRKKQIWVWQKYKECLSILKILKTAGESESRSVPVGEEQKKYAPPHT